VFNNEKNGDVKMAVGFGADKVSDPGMFILWSSAIVGASKNKN